MFMTLLYDLIDIFSDVYDLIIWSNFVHFNINYWVGGSLFKGKNK